MLISQIKIKTNTHVSIFECHQRCFRNEVGNIYAHLYSTNVISAL